MSHSPPVSGQSVGPFIQNTAMWTDILGVVEWWRQNQANQFRPSFIGNSRACGINNTGAVLEAGTLVQLADFDVLPAAVLDFEKHAPATDVELPVWHSDIDNVFPLHQDLPDGDSLFLGVRYMPATFDVTVDVNHRFAMVDPDSPDKLKSATAGIFRIVGKVDDKVAVVDTYHGYFNWRFELTGDWTGSTAPAKLLNWDGTEFASSITLSDPDLIAGDMESGSKGYCHHIGNEFIVYQGPCTDDSGPVLPTP